MIIKKLYKRKNNKTLKYEDRSGLECNSLMKQKCNQKKYQLHRIN